MNVEPPTPVHARVQLGQAALLPDLDRPGGWLLTVDDTPQSYVDLGDPTHLEFEYVRRIGHVLDRAADPGVPLAVLHLGGGALTVPRYVAATRPGSDQLVVESDGALLKLIRRRLPWPAGIDALAADARAAVPAQPAGRWELAVLDVFDGARVPAGLTSVEFLRAVRATAPSLAVNLADGGSLPYARAVAATALAVFGVVSLVAEPAVLHGRRFGNVVLVAGSDLPTTGLARALAGDPFPARLISGTDLAELVGDAAVITDASATASPSPPPENGWTADPTRPGPTRRPG